MNLMHLLDLMAVILLAARIWCLQAAATTCTVLRWSNAPLHAKVLPAQIQLDKCQHARVLSADLFVARELVGAEGLVLWA